MNDEERVHKMTTSELFVLLAHPDLHTPLNQSPLLSPHKMIFKWHLKVKQYYKQHQHYNSNVLT